MDVGRSAGAGGDDCFWLGHQQGGGAGSDSFVAAEIDRAVLPRGGTGRARRRERGLRFAVAEERRWAAGIFCESDYGRGGALAGLGAIPGYPGVCGVEALPASANLRTFWGGSEAGDL